MAKTITTGSESQRKFAKVISSMTGKYSLWQLWRDVIHCYACAVSNSVDLQHREAREAEYMSTINKYDESERMRIAELGAIMVEGMEEDAQNGTYRDYLGELFMQLELGSNLGGQFFTPYPLCQFMAQSAMNERQYKMELEKQGWISVADVACGAGATLIAGMETLRSMGINYQQNCLFFGQEIDQTTALMCYIQLSLHGCAGLVRVDDTLRKPFTGNLLFGGDQSENNWYTPMFFSEVWHGRRIARRMDDILNSMAPREKQPETAPPAPAVEGAPPKVEGAPSKVEGARIEVDETPAAVEEASASLPAEPEEPKQKRKSKKREEPQPEQLSFFWE